MTTLGDLVEDILGHLNSFGESRDLVTSLTAGIDNDDVTFQVAEPRSVSRGLLEIGDELMEVKSVDSSTGLVTLHPWGRGVRGTTAASHLADVKVTSNPRFPRSVVKREISNAIEYLYPQLFAIATDETQTVNPARTTYELPAACESIVRIQYETFGPSRMWYPVTRYRVDYNADATDFTSGKSVDIFASMAPGRTIKIVYRRNFGSLSADSDTLASAYLSENYSDILRMIVVGRLLMTADNVRVDLDSIESSNRAQTTQPSSAVSIARQYLLQADVRMAQERRRLLTLYPSTQVRMS